ncbi:MAG TPA: PQQ-binding-like beta-propeller repeat protein [Pirellulales bacterium]|nr:PQQ-binding-like beta-propeller repeat protein [Pirellulales bacterium]
MGITEVADCRQTPVRADAAISSGQVAPGLVPGGSDVDREMPATRAGAISREESCKVNRSVPATRAGATVLILCMLLLRSSPARGQIMIAAPVAVEATDKDAEEKKKRPFSLPAQKSEVTEALAEFRRLSEKGTWERAFKELEKVQQADANALTPADDGLYMPTRLVIRQALAELPAAGKQAYRLFHDAEAKVLLEQAQGKDEVDKLRKIFSDYFITSVGDAAADRLGDIYFEQGDMDKAAECWQAVLRWQPETALPRVRLLVKTAIARARGGHWDEFAELEREVRQRHAGEAVVLGGKTVPAEEHLRALAEQRDAEPAVDLAEAGAVRADVELPGAPEPLWQFRIFGVREAQSLAQVGQNWGWQIRFPVTEMVPAVALDAQRVYLNYMGYLLALDQKTGKLLWRTGRLTDLPQKVQNNQFHFPEQYSVVVSGDTLWCVYRDVAQIGQQGQPFRIGRWEAATGKPGWSSQTINDLQQWNMQGRALPVGDRVYVAASKNGQGAESHVLCLQASDGKLLWSTLLGTHQVDQTQMWHRRSAQPSLALSGGKLYVDTHAGGLLALDAQGGAIEWGFAYDSSTPDPNYWYNQAATLATAGPPCIVGGTMYLKGMRSDRLYALDLAGPKVLWKRPVSESAMIVGVDGDRLYLTGEDVMAIDLADRQLKWAATLPTATGWIRPLLTADRIYQFTSRGIFELDKSNGDTVRLFRGSDLDSLGGVLLATKDQLLSISNLSVTAYPLSAPPKSGEATAATRK